MSYSQVYTNEEGEILGTDTIYEDEYFEEDFYEQDYEEDDFEDDTFRSEQESDLAEEYS